MPGATAAGLVVEEPTTEDECPSDDEDVRLDEVAAAAAAAADMINAFR